MSARTRARRRALELLFESEARGIDISVLVPLRSSDPDYPMKAYAVQIVDGVTAHLDEIDAPVAISEAQSLAQDFSTDESPGYVSGVLSRIAGLQD